MANGVCVSASTPARQATPTSQDDFSKEKLIAAIEERDRLLQELEASRRHYAELFDSAPIPYFTLGQDASILEVNLAGAALVGRERSTIVGTPFGSVVRLDDAMAFSTHLCKVLASASPVSEEVSFTSDAGHVTCQVVSVAIRSGREAPTACRTAFIDVTQQKLAEVRLRQIEERERSRYEFLANAAPLLTEVARGLRGDAPGHRTRRGPRAGRRVRHRSRAGARRHAQEGGGPRRGSLQTEGPRRAPRRRPARSAGRPACHRGEAARALRVRAGPGTSRRSLGEARPERAAVLDRRADDRARARHRRTSPGHGGVGAHVHRPRLAARSGGRAHGRPRGQPGDRLRRRAHRHRSAGQPAHLHRARRPQLPVDDPHGRRAPVARGAPRANAARGANSSTPSSAPRCGWSTSSRACAMRR